MIYKNSPGVTILCTSWLWFLHTSYLTQTSHHFMEAGRRCEPPRTETKHFIAHGKERNRNISMYISFLGPKSHKGDITWAQTDAWTCNGYCCRRGTLSFRNPPFYNNMLAGCLPASAGKLISVNTTLKEDPENEWSGPYVLGIPNKICRSIKVPWRAMSSKSVYSYQAL